MKGEKTVQVLQVSSAVPPCLFLPGLADVGTTLSRARTEQDLKEMQSIIYGFRNSGSPDAYIEWASNKVISS